MTRSIEFKMIVSIVLFTLFTFGLERYQMSLSIKKQFIDFKKSKNELLINTITPVLGLNFSLGLDSANKEYLEEIQAQNKDLEFVSLVDTNNNTIYIHNTKELPKLEDKYEYNYWVKDIVDEYTKEKLATLELRFSNLELENMRKSNLEITTNIALITIVLLIFFIIFTKLIFKSLNELRDSVLKYDPKKNNFPLDLSNNKDEVTLMRNAIISMVNKITAYTEILDNTNSLLEEKVKQRTLELEKSNLELKRLASVDPLTKLYNRRHFTNSSEHILEISKRNKTPLSMIMMDIDNFKYVNDTYGHQFGDKVIVSVASTLMETIRKSDVVCRFGGEEFIVLLPQTDLDGAYAIAEKIRKKIEKTELTLNEKVISITVSVGVAELNILEDNSIENIIHRADSHMYTAKQSGKNRTCISA